MDKTYREKILDVKRENEVGFVNFFNDGSVTTSLVEESNEMASIGNYSNVYMVGEIFYKMARAYAANIDYDFLKMNLNVGLIYGICDVENNTIKEGSKPIPEIVTYYAKDLEAYNYGDMVEQTKHDDLGYGRKGYFCYDTFVKAMDEQGLSFNGPKTYEEFRKKVLSGEPFDINISVDLIENRDLENVIKKEVKEEKSAVKKLFKKFF